MLSSYCQFSDIFKVSAWNLHCFDGPTGDIVCTDCATLLVLYSIAGAFLRESHQCRKGDSGNFGWLSISSPVWEKLFKSFISSHSHIFDTPSFSLFSLFYLFVILFGCILALLCYHTHFNQQQILPLNTPLFYSITLPIRHSIAASLLKTAVSPTPYRPCKTGRIVAGSCLYSF